MSDNLKQIAHLEWTNYAATQAIAEKTPGLTLVLQEDAIITGSELFPIPDTTHACLLRTSADNAERLIDNIVDYFQSRDLPPAIYLSPACTPGDLQARLLSRGFKAQPEQEAWLTFNLAGFDIPAVSSALDMQRLEADQALIFTQVFMAAFDMPPDYAPYMAQLLAPSIGLPGVYHYLALANGEPVAIFSLICYKTFGVMGSAAVIPTYRRRGVITNLILTAAYDAKREGIETIITQTTANAPVERLLRIYGFKKIFTRTGYTLP